MGQPVAEYVSMLNLRHPRRTSSAPRVSFSVCERLETFHHQIFSKFHQLIASKNVFFLAKDSSEYFLSEEQTKQKGRK